MYLVLGTYICTVHTGNTRSTWYRCSTSMYAPRVGKNKVKNRNRYVRRQLLFVLCVCSGRQLYIVLSKVRTTIKSKTDAFNTRPIMRGGARCGAAVVHRVEDTVVAGRGSPPHSKNVRT